ncbi:MAG: FeoC-like transcriptional regulator [Gammaproteobacteria bacterium]|nr:FeoC-like transcriptional regulator [Gammaproteobacteria bacterium]MBU1656352.1 FeoC-like transcriptional regulator [Gammaproteobacteria bacterium]MBU1959916.1 FeoC-like transcriptional regulator [Gammaproteobacteria bacterium]
MILREIGRYLELRGQAGLRDIALHVDAEESAVRCMLERWVRSGRVGRLSAMPSCGSACAKCSPRETELYIWRDGIKAQPLPPPSLICN